MPLKRMVWGLPSVERRAPMSTQIKPGERNDYSLLAVLALGHAFNDFCMGVTSPMIPTLEEKYGLTLGAVAGLVISLGLVGNFSQPIAGWFLDRAKTSRVLVITPLLSGCSMLIGFTAEPWQARCLFFVSGLGIGIFHPYAFLLARTTLVGRPALATSIFISLGFFGVSFGQMVSGMWMESVGLRAFHFLYAVAFVSAAGYLSKGIHKVRLEHYHAHGAEPVPTNPESASDAPSPTAAENRPVQIPFAFLFLLGFLIAIEGGTLVFFIPKLFQVLYGSEGLGGQTTFIFGLTGGLVSYFYAYLADRGNPYRIALWAQVFGIAPLFGFFFFPGSAAKMAMIFLVALTFGGIFPPLASIAPRARGLTMGMRSALMFGGVWGSSVVVSYAMAKISDMGYELETVMSSIRVIPFALIPALAYASRRYLA